MKEEWLVYKLREILNEIEYMSEDTDIVLLANKGLDEIDKYQGKSKFTIVKNAKRT